MIQTELDFVGISLTPQNNKESEEILLDHYKRLDNNCKKIYRALLSGSVLTGRAMQEMGMSEYRRRIKTLRDSGIILKEKKLKNGCKAWYL